MSNMHKLQKYKAKIGGSEHLFDKQTKDLIYKIINDFSDIPYVLSESNPTQTNTTYGEKLIEFSIGDMFFYLKKVNNAFFEDNVIAQETIYMQMVNLCSMGTGNLDFTNEEYYKVLEMIVILGYFYSSSSIVSKFQLANIENLDKFTKSIVKMTLSFVKKLEQQHK